MVVAVTVMPDETCSGSIRRGSRAATGEEIGSGDDGDDDDDSWVHTSEHLRCDIPAMQLTAQWFSSVRSVQHCSVCASVAVVGGGNA
jgi:hypothetical protein